ncbi:MAG TPA: TetR/AcrR family transcriptional regulator [Kofleriaceae bacterium]|nr:TetR/AcrR family transcriptional regulator [Kofleriaceae bacterium]
MTTAQQRKQQERQARRRRIQRAAREVFAEKGYAKTSIEQVARQASLSVGAIYLYFRSKEDLYVSLLEETFEVFEAEMRQLRGRTDLHSGDRLQSAWLFLSQWAVADVEGTRMLRLVSQPGVRKQLSDEVAVAAKAGLEMLRDSLAAMVQGGIDTGAYRAVDARDTADLLWSLFLGLLESNDGRLNLEIEGASFTESSRAALALLEGSLRQAAGRVAEAA